MEETDHRQEEPDMDVTDRALIEALRSNARASWVELGRAVGMSGPSVTERVQRLEQAGVITGYHAAVKPSAIGLSVAALVGVYLTDTSDQDAVTVALGKLEEVEDCWFVAGDEAFLLKVRVADVVSLERTLSRLRRIRGVARTRTTVVLSTKWENRISPPGDPDGPDLP
jgi:Lrp/AsnC family leucine-responsive transcriptional regulator